MLKDKYYNSDKQMHQKELEMTTEGHQETDTFETNANIQYLNYSGG